MNYLALYRKYRPTIFEDVAGQKFVVEVLKNSIDKGFISHAYLFSGPRGTGKTTLAKIIAKTINCENLVGHNFCDKCASCIGFNEKNNSDIIEIDAASNNGVEEIRKIRDSVNLMPSISKYKVYIIDEVHMLSTGAFNALLKTLEEPPKHVIFILATTEFYKIPETIISRCQCFNFERISNSEIVKKLEYIVSSENISIDHEVLSLIAKYSDGGLRDAISMLDKLISYTDNVTIDDYYNLKGIVNGDMLKSLFEYIYNNDINNLMNLIDELVNYGKDLIILIESLMGYCKELLINSFKSNDGVYDNDYLYDLIVKLNDLDLILKKTKNKRIMFETGLIKIVQDLNCGKSINKSEDVVIETNVCDNSIVNDTAKVIIDSKGLGISNSVDKSINNDNLDVVDGVVEKGYNKKIRINNAFALANKKILSDLKIRWIEFSSYISNDDVSSIVSYLIDSTLRVAGEKNLILSVKYDSILKNIDSNIIKIEAFFNDVMGTNFKLVFINDTEWDIIRNDYVVNLKNNKPYVYIEEIDDDDKNSDVVVSDDISETLVDAISLFGKDIVELK